MEQSEESEIVLDGGVNPLAVIIPLGALVATLLFGGSVLLLRSTYLSSEAKAALRSDNHQLTPSAFTSAVFEGDIELVNRYLHAGLSPKQEDSSGRTPLYAAIDRGNLQILEALLKQSLPLSESKSRRLSTLSPQELAERDCYGGGSPLNYAAARGKPSVLQLLLTYSGGAIGGDAGVLSPLSCAAAANNTANLEWLLDHGADPNKLDKGDKTALSYGVISRRTGAVQLLLQAGADPRTKIAHGETVIFDAARDGDEAIVSLLLQYPLNLNQENFRGDKPWQVAESAGRFELVPLLHPEYLLYAGLSKQNKKVVSFALERGARVNVSDRDGVTPLLVSLSDGSPNRVRFLLKSPIGSNFAAKPGQSLTLVNNQTLTGQFENVRRLINRLDKKGALPVGEDSMYSQLMAPSILLEEIDRGSAPYIPGSVLPALREDATSLTSLLLLTKADPNAADIDGNTPLLYAVQRGEESLVEELLKSGANYTIANNSGVTPLLQAVRLNRQDLALKMLNHNPPTGLALDRTLLAAIESGQNTVAAKLLKLGASPEGSDRAGRKLIIIALSLGNFEIAEALRVTGASLDLTEKTAQALYLYAIRDKQPRLREFFEQYASGLDQVAVGELERAIQKRL